MLTRRQEPPLDQQAIEEAADWLMRLSEDELDETERAEWEHWKTSTPARIRAWGRVQALQSKLGGVPPSLAMSALDRPGSPARRAALGKLAALLAVVPVGWGGWKLAEVQQWSADHRTLVGQQRELTLADGSTVTLNTDTAIDVRFDAQQRLIHLRDGEIQVQTAADPAQPPRPFRVATRQGHLQALGTRFTVRQLQPRTQLVVLEGAVQVELAGNSQSAPLIVHAGQHSDFSSSAFGELSLAAPHSNAWTQGMLMADNLRLDDFIAELTRYHRGVLRLDPAIAGVRISGAYPVIDTRRTLNMLVRTYPIRVSDPLLGMWVTLSHA